MMRREANRVIQKILSNSSKGLHQFCKPKPEIVVANNSGIFFTYSALFSHGKASHPFLTMFAPKFWLDDVHSDYDNLHWGQNERGLPRHVRVKFMELFPEHPPGELIKWGQMRQLREYIFRQFKLIGIDVIPGLPNINKEETGYYLTSGEYAFHTAADTHFYSSFRIPKTLHQFNSTLPSRPHTNLYSLSKRLAPESVVILGGGRSAIWVAQHFPDMLVSCFTDSEDIPLMSGEEIPSNLDVYYSNINAPNKGSLEILPARNEREVMIVNGSDVKVKGEFFLAVGLTTDESYLQEVNPNNVTKYPYSAKEQWIASEALPAGSLMEATQRWAIVTGNMGWTYEPHAFYKSGFDSFIDGLSNRHGVLLPANFFDEIRSRVYDYQGDQDHRRVPDIEDTLSLYKDSLLAAFYGNENEVESLWKLVKNEIIKCEETNVHVNCKGHKR